MNKYVLFDEIHLTVRVPADLEESTCEAVQRILEGRSFQTALHRAVRRVVRQYPDLDPVRVRISR
ncbi:MAG: hypothetical protein ACYC3I_13025 [Gemmataceae bacterium]